MGYHILVDGYGIDEERLKRRETVKKLMDQVVAEAGLHKVGELYHEFEPWGVTGVILLAESHISIHTWPEHRSLAADIFCCSGQEDAERAFKVLEKIFSPTSINKQVYQR